MSEHPWRDHAVRYTIAASSTLAIALASPPNGLPWMDWLGFAPLAYVIGDPAVTRRGALGLGFVGGLCAGIIGFPWIVGLLELFAGLPWWLSVALWLAFSAWTALQWGLWALLVHAGPRGAWRIVWGVIVWTAVASAWPAIFPFTIALGLVQVPEWMQAAELGGVAVVEAQLVVCGMLLARGMRAPSLRGKLTLGLFALAIPLGSWALGHWRMQVLDEQAADARRVTFGVVQSNTPLRWSDRRAKVQKLRDASRDAQAAGAQVIVWPEAGVYPYRVTRPMRHDFADERRRVLHSHRLPTIFGAPSYAEDADYGYNTVFDMAADGTVLGHFDKVHLMPFGEYIPIVDPEWAQSYIPQMSHNLAGEGPARFPIDPPATAAHPDPGPRFHVGPLICYEDIFPEFARGVAAQAGGIEAFVNVTIDTWFGATAEPWQHLGLAQFRSVEHRIPMVRSVSSGVSAVVDHNGRISAQLPVRDSTARSPFPAEILVHDVVLPRNTEAHPTVFARFGHGFVPLCQWTLLAWVLARVLRSRYGRSRLSA